MWRLTSIILNMGSSVSTLNMTKVIFSLDANFAGNMLYVLEKSETEAQYPDIQFWRRASDPVLAHDSFSSLMWTLFCLPSPFLSCKESFFCLVHIFYVVTITQVVASHV